MPSIDKLTPSVDKRRHPVSMTVKCPAPNYCKGVRIAILYPEGRPKVLQQPAQIYTILPTTLRRYHVRLAVCVIMNITECSQLHRMPEHGSLPKQHWTLHSIDKPLQHLLVTIIIRTNSIIGTRMRNSTRDRE